MTTFHVAITIYAAIAAGFLVGWFAFSAPPKTREAFGVIALAIAWPIILAAFTVVIAVDVLLGAEWSSR